jgi:Bacterial Ig-like domain (group 3)
LLYTATYTAGGNCAPNTAGPLLVVVNLPSTSASVAEPEGVLTAGMSFTLSASVFPTGQGNGSPTGQVVFWEGSTVVGGAVLMYGVNGLAASTSMVLSAGEHDVYAIYEGSPNYAASASDPLTLFIEPAPVRVAILNSNGRPAPVTLGPGCGQVTVVSDPGTVISALLRPASPRAVGTAVWRGNNTKHGYDAGFLAGNPAPVEICLTRGGVESYWFCASQHISVAGN